MRPNKDSEIKEIDSNVFRFTDKSDSNDMNKKIRSPAQVIENNRFISFFLAISLFLFIGLIFYKKGFSLDLILLVGLF